MKKEDLKAPDTFSEAETFVLQLISIAPQGTTGDIAQIDHTTEALLAIVDNSPQLKQISFQSDIPQHARNAEWEVSPDVRQFAADTVQFAHTLTKKVILDNDHILQTAMTLVNPANMLFTRGDRGALIFGRKIFLEHSISPQIQDSLGLEIGSIVLSNFRSVLIDAFRAHGITVTPEYINQLALCQVIFHEWGHGFDISAFLDQTDSFQPVVEFEDLDDNTQQYIHRERIATSFEMQFLHQVISNTQGLEIADQIIGSVQNRRLKKLAFYKELYKTAQQKDIDPENISQIIVNFVTLLRNNGRTRAADKISSMGTARLWEDIGRNMPIFSVPQLAGMFKKGDQHLRHIFITYNNLCT